ncbi:MAG: aldehyde dehydrogenase family protein [Roseiflexaceae bacterium]|nr:aldehyde dehydrogenase family protein [Roseiflexaceae bacterium]
MTQNITALFATQRALRWAMAQTSPAERRHRLLRLKAALVHHRPALYRAFAADYGKPQVEVELTEIMPVLSEIDHAVAQLARWMRPRAAATPLLLAGSRSEVRCEPKGVVLILGPFNYPLLLLLSPLVAAIAAGNCAILRPSEKVPQVARVIGELIAAAFPPEEVALVVGEVDLAEALLDLPFDHIFFTGSGAVGRKVMRAAAQQLASVTLELGGKSPAIVDASANLSAVVKRLIWGKMTNAGQTCVAPDYVLVHASRLDAFIAEAQRAIIGFYGPDPVAQLASPDLAQVIDQAAFARLTRLLERAVAAGASVAAGGVADQDRRKIAPTLLCNVTADNPIMAEEIFGPLLPVLAYHDLTEALTLVNGHDKPLALYIFSQDEQAIAHILAHTSAGGTVVNDTLIHLGNPNLPFGGTGPSGMGSYHGEYGFRAFSHERAVMRQARISLLPLLYPPYTPVARGIGQLVSGLITVVLPAVQRVFRR